MTTDSENTNAAAKADDLIAAEINVQQKMWGDPNERADGQNGQLLDAALTTITAIGITMKMPYYKRAAAFEDAKNMFYPRDWSPDAFRDYGSDVANLVVAAAYLRNEIKRRIIRGEDTFRTQRSKPYVNAAPKRSALEILLDLTQGTEVCRLGETHIGRIGSVHPSPEPALTINEHAHGDDASHK